MEGEGIGRMGGCGMMTTRGGMAGLVKKDGFTLVMSAILNKVTAVRGFGGEGLSVGVRLEKG